MPPAKVRGYEKPVRVFAVVNYKNPESGPQTLDQLRNLLNIVAPDISNPNTDEDKQGRNEICNRRCAHDRRCIHERRCVHERRKNNGHDSDRTDIGDVTDPTITMTSFGSSARVYGPAGSLVPVFFSWNKHNFRSDTNVIVEVALDQEFDNILEEREVIAAVSISIPLADGQYWWRVYPANPGSREPANAVYPSGVLMVDTNAKEKIKIQKD
jgi:hypothetical protein